MTYGAALPRIKPRPTLDNLREPLVPIGTRPSSLSRNAPNVYQSPVQSSIPHPTATPAYSYPTDRRSSRISASTNALNTTPQPTIHTTTTTDEFGYPSTHVDYTYDTREPSPSILVEPPSPSATAPSSPSKGKPAAKTKHKLHLHLGSLGRTKKDQKAEPARLRDITDIRVANPMFTRENLQQRNYDAFFESGVPVYSLERHSPVRPSSPEPEGPMSASSERRPHSLGFFHKSKPATTAAAVTFRSQSAEIADPVPQKGDRCHSLNFWFDPH